MSITLNDIDFELVISILTLIASFIALFVNTAPFLRGNKTKKKNWIPLILTIIALLTVIVVSFYYSSKTTKMNEQYFALISNQEDYSNKGKFVNEDKNNTLRKIDSLTKVLSEYSNKIEKTRFISGNKTDLSVPIDSLINKINSYKLEIEKYNDIEPKYNDIINEDDILPNKTGIITSGNSNDFDFICPTDTTSEYLDLVLQFHDDKLVNDVACIYLYIFTNHTLLFTQTYKPQPGKNYIRINNYMKKANVTLQIGYISKGTSETSTPRFEKVTCSSRVVKQ